jgi:predicted nucleotidyltransferase
MNLSRPYGVVSHRLDGAVLHVLAGTTGWLTGRKVARLASEGTQQGVWKALGRLVEEGVVEHEEAGSAILYKLNRRHLAAGAIAQLVNLRQELLRRLVEQLAEWQVPPLHASMFGSAARGEGDARSDIDLLIVRPPEVESEDPVWRGQIDRLIRDVEDWTGNRASIAELGAEDLPELSRKRPAILDSLEGEALPLAGADVRTILRAVA